MASGSPPSDPQRRVVLKTIGVLATAGISTLAVRLAFWDRNSAPASLEVPPHQISTTGPATPAAEVVRTSTVPATTTTTATTTTNPAPVVIQVLSKQGWNARESGPFDGHTPLQLTIHHSASAASDPAGAPDRIRGYQGYHQDQGWPDVAYHFVIDQAGRVYEGRPVEACGDTFTEYDPTGHFLVCLDGDFDVVTPSAESITALVSILAWGSMKFGIDPETLTGHRDHAITTCPGEFLYELRDEIAERVDRLLIGGRAIEMQLTESLG
jgi:hypothetical protein